MDDFSSQLSMESLRATIDCSARYLHSMAICDEDNLAHNGRRAYSWTLMRWLYEHKSEEEWLILMEDIASDLYPTIKRNETGSMVIFPGLHERRNYSSNAIDCGILVDAFHDYLEVLPGKATVLRAKVDEVARSYLAKKLEGDNRIHNQYLWAGTGLARWLAANKNDRDASIYQGLLEKNLLKWLSYNEGDGYSPYKSDPLMPYQDAVTTYYHSRCLAFSWYILEHCEIQKSNFEDAL